MIKKLLYTLLTFITLSCSHTIDKKDIISKVTNDNLKLKRVDLVEESNYYNVITDLKNSVNSSKEAWENAPELKQLHRLISIDKVSKKFLEKLYAGNYLDDDKVIAYRFIKMNKSKEYLGYAVVIFHNQNQSTLYYEINATPYEYYPTGGVKQLINKGLVTEINKIEAEYNNEHPLKPENQ
jgi:hypothetical protein